MKGAWRSRLYSRQLVVGLRRRPAEDSARFAFAAARGFRFGSDWALSVIRTPLTKRLPA